MLRTPFTPYTSYTVRIPPTSALVVLFTALTSMILTLTPVTGHLGGSLNGQSKCNTEMCWHLYQISLDYYQVQEPIQTTPEKWRGACISHRTYYKCLLKALYHNSSQDCPVDLGFRSSYTGIQKKMQEMNCSLNGTVFDPEKAPKDRRQVCTYDGAPALRYCSLFGDPHLRTFYNKVETCEIQGAWPLLDNRFLTVQVTSKTVDNQMGPATAITELTVMIKKQMDCAAERFITYQAEAGFLPPMFDDGSTHFGPERSVELEEFSPNEHVEILLRYIDTRVVIRQYTSFLTVSVLMPETILNESVSYLQADSGVHSVPKVQLCLQGCASNQLIDYTRYLSQGTATPVTDRNTQNHYLSEKPTVDAMMVRMNRDVAYDRCRHLGLVDFYLDSCVFDLMNTGDEKFARAAADSMNDTVRLHPEHRAILHNRTKLTLKGTEERDVPSSTRILNNLHYLHRTTYVLLVSMVTCALNYLHESLVVTLATRLLGL